MNAPRSFDLGRAPEEPDTVLIGEHGCLFARVVGRPDHPAEPIAAQFAATPLLVAACRAMLAAHASLFGQCLSNPVRNAWQQVVDLTLVNDAADAARAALKAAGLSPDPPLRSAS